MEEIDFTVFKATHRGKLSIADKVIPCAVLENGKRVISQNGLFNAFDRAKRGGKNDEGTPAIVSAKNLQCLITDDLKNKLEVIHYYHANGKVANGFDAELISLICELYIDAKESNVLQSNQEHLYRRAVTLIRSFAKVGITALIDEATGYQYDRETQELQKLLEAYIAKDLMKWQKRFPNTYYREIFRLHGWDYDPTSKSRPSYIGKFTNQYVYDLFPISVMEEIKKRNPVLKNTSRSFRKKRHHQFFTTDIGIKQLDDCISKMLGVMKLSKNIKEFEQNYNTAFDEEIEIKKLQDGIDN